MQWLLLAHTVYVELAAEAAHGDLKGLGTAFWSEAEDFAVEDQIAGGQRTNGFDHFGRGRRDVVQLARVEADVIAVLVDLDTCAVELVLEGEIAELFDRFFDAFGGLG